MRSPEGAGAPVLSQGLLPLRPLPLSGFYIGDTEKTGRDFVRNFGLSTQSGTSKQGREHELLATTGAPPNPLAVGLARRLAVKEHQEADTLPSAPHPAMYAVTASAPQVGRCRVFLVPLHRLRLSSLIAASPARIRVTSALAPGAEEVEV